MKGIKILFHLSWLTSLFFLLVALDTYYFKSNMVIVGVIRELITLPLMGAQLVIATWSIYAGIKDPSKIKGYALWTLIISICNSAIVLWTFLS